MPSNGHGVGLVLTREVGQQVVITVPASDEPTRVVFTLVDVRGPKVRCGFLALKTATVHRSEVQEQIKEAGRGTDVLVRTRRRHSGDAKREGEPLYHC